MVCNMDPQICAKQSEEPYPQNELDDIIGSPQTWHLRGGCLNPLGTWDGQNWGKIFNNFIHNF